MKRIVCVYSAKRYRDLMRFDACTRIARVAKCEGARIARRASKRFHSVHPLVNIRTALFPVMYSTIHLQDTPVVA